MTRDYNESYPPCLNTVIADGKPHRKRKIQIKTAIVDVSPRKLVMPESGAVFDLCPALAGVKAYDAAPWIVEVPGDMPGRDMFDKATAFAELVYVQAYKMKLEHRYYIDQGDATMAAYVEGQILVCAANGVLVLPAVPAGTTLDVFGIFGFEFIDYTDTNEILVEYIGRVAIDNSA